MNIDTRILDIIAKSPDPTSGADIIRSLRFLPASTVKFKIASLLERGLLTIEPGTARGWQDSVSLTAEGRKAVDQGVL